MTRKWIYKMLICIGVFVAAGRAGFGQTATATISGRVTDSGGAVIAGASVDVVSVERGTLRSVPSNGAGIYVLRPVEPGHYNITVKQSGFKQGEVHDLVVEVGAQLEQNFQLEIGSARETVTVEAAEPLVNTISATVSSVVTGATIQDLPLNGRDTLQLALTAPGVTPNPGTGNSFSIAGARNSAS